MNNKKLVILVIGLLVISLTLVACNSSANNFPTGKFIKSGTQNCGLIFNEDMTFSVFDGGTTLVRGTYSVDGDTYIEESNDASCSVPMKFKFSFDGKNLTFNYVGNPGDDTCSGRWTDFNNVTYSMSE